ncbi:hypothetical protein TNCT_377181 [Trichonephila clavata]|uniref:Uncharacterized protein n=1 Tax=Trichonephila clavata TaxID=2740835 RepID=A0A8X6HMG1_TRICU|nr:hypothetical protein TNCT_377181 [Trichonephila clavata]
MHVHPKEEKRFRTLRMKLLWAFQNIELRKVKNAVSAAQRRAFVEMIPYVFTTANTEGKVFDFRFFFLLTCHDRKTELGFYFITEISDVRGLDNHCIVERRSLSLVKFTESGTLRIGNYAMQS